MLILAVHIADGFPFAWPWIVGGFVASAVLIAIGCSRISDSEVPLAALITAALFVASIIHIRVGPTSVHLLLNGLAGVLLGLRVGPAIAVSLTMQAVLLGHGGFSTLGINICVLTLPALAAGLAYRFVFASTVWNRGLARAILVFIAITLWFGAVIVGLRMITTQFDSLMRNPWVWAVVAVIGVAGVLMERRLETDPTFAVGLLLGVATTLLTVALNVFVLRTALPSDAEPIAGIVFLAHMPVAAIEGVVLGSTLSLLKRSAPQLLPRSGLSRVDPGK
jgi:ABC-type Co2+ transport system permease subunit